MWTTTKRRGGGRAVYYVRIHRGRNSPAGLLDLPAVGLQKLSKLSVCECVKNGEGEGGGRAIAATYNQKPRSRRGSVLRATCVAMVQGPACVKERERKIKKSLQYRTSADGCAG